MVEITGTTSVAPISASRVSDSSPAKRRNFDYQILLDDGQGQALDLGEAGWTSYLRSIRILERVDGVSELRIRFHDPQGDPISNSQKIVNGARIQIRIGWRETEIIDHGIFHVVSWEQVDGQKRTFELLALNNGVKLAREGEVQRAWERPDGRGIKDSDIVRMIARKHDLVPMIQDTKVEYRHVMQASETDYDFLCRRARLYGYLFYVLGPVLYFRPVKFDQSKHSLLLRVDPENFADNIGTIRMRTDPFRKAQITRKAQINAMTFDLLNESGRYERDEVARSAGSSIKSSLALSTWPEARTRPVKYLIHEGHLQTADEIRRQLDEAIKSSGFAVVEVECSSRGLEESVPGQSIVVQFDDDYRYSGLYFIRRVEHVWDSAGDRTYITRFNLVRSFEHFARGEPRFGVANSLSNSQGGGGLYPTGVTGFIE